MQWDGGAAEAGGRVWARWGGRDGQGNSAHDTGLLCCSAAAAAAFDALTRAPLVGRGGCEERH